MRAPPPAPARRRGAARHWPDAALAVLVAAAALGPALPGHRLWWLGPWTLGAAAVLRSVQRNLRLGRRRERTDEARVIVLALAGAHLLIAATGGVLSPWWLAYAPVLAWGGARIGAAWYQGVLFGAVALMEGVAALQAPGQGAGGPLRLGVSLGLLGLLQAVLAALLRATHRERAALEEDLEKHERLQDAAEEFRHLAEHRRGSTTAALSAEEERVRRLGQLVDQDGALDRLLGLARRALGARGVALFLLSEDGEQLLLRRVVTAGTLPAPAAALRLGEGIIGQAAKQRRPLLLTDLEEGRVRAPWHAESLPVAALAAVPVEEQGVLRGVLVADSGGPGAFVREHGGLLEGFAAEIGALLEQARAAALRERRSDRNLTLRTINQSLSETLALDELLEKMLDLTREIIPYDRGAVFLADPAARLLTLCAQKGFAGVEPGTTMRWSRGIPGFLATHGRALLFTDLKKRRRGVEIVPGAPGQNRIRGLLGVPLRHSTELVGVWVLASDETHRFNSLHLESLTEVAAQAAILVSNAALHREIERKAVTDGLTGLYNHRHFQDRLGEEIERAGRSGEPFSLLLLDIDHFKAVNDTHGHPFGDRVLRTLAGELQQLARKVDFVARYGGEEFALILASTDRRGARATAERILKTVRAIRIPREGAEFAFTVSIGAATRPDDADSREELVRAADEALYAAKKGGRDRLVQHGEVPR